jgi:hypothetical protein
MTAEKDITKKAIIPCKLSVEEIMLIKTLVGMTALCGSRRLYDTGRALLGRLEAALRRRRFPEDMIARIVKP